MSKKSENTPQQTQTSLPLPLMSEGSSPKISTASTRTRRNASSELFKQNINIESNKSDNSYDKKIFHKRLNQELDQLSVSHKKVFIMRMKHNLSIKEIAEIMETSEGTIKSRIFYTLKKLSENLKEFNPASSVALILLINELLFNS